MEEDEFFEEGVVRFNGPDYIPVRDNQRLISQFQRILNLMLDGRPRTLRQIAKVTGDPEALISAQIRHAQKERFGSYEVEKSYLGKGVFTYRIVK